MRATILSLILLFVFSFAYSQEKISKKELKKAEQAEQFEQIKQLIESRSFEFIGQAAYPQKGKRIDLTTRSNFLRLENDSASASLPFFGRAYSGGYGSGSGGIEFSGKHDSYSTKQNEKKHNILIEFKIQGEGDSYTCILTVQRGGSASLHITSNKKAGISYQGNVSAIKK